MTKIAALAGLLLAALGVSPAPAEVIKFELTSDHCTDNCLTQANPSAGTITVTDIAGGVTIGVALNSGFTFNAGGFDAEFGFNLIGNPTITGSAIPADYALVSSTAGVLHIDGTGDFEYGFNALFGNGFSNSKPGPYTFTILGSVSTASFEQNAIGQFFALDVASTVNGSVKTGAIDASDGVCTSCTQSTTPEPASISLVGGIILLAAGAIRRKVVRG